jgi:hypothetical protein
MSADSSELSRLVVEHRPKFAQLGFPPWLRARIARYVRQRHGQGVSYGVLADEVGISRTTLAHWSRALTPEKSGGFARVMVEAPPMLPRQAAMLSVQAGPPPSCAGHGRLRLVSPHGFILEGIDFDRALQALSVLR